MSTLQDRVKIEDIEATLRAAPFPQERTFTQQVIDRRFPLPLQAYGSAYWVVGRWVAPDEWTKKPRACKANII